MDRRHFLTFGAASLWPAAVIARGSAAPVRQGSPTVLSTGVKGHVLDVRSFGANADGKTKDTQAIQKAINAAFELKGATVYCGPGVYLTGGLELRSNVTLYLDSDAVLLGSPDLADYPPRRGPYPHGDANNRHLIFARDAENVRLCGLGRIDGQGRKYWVRDPHFRLDPAKGWKQCYKPFISLPGDARPSPMLEFYRCRNLRIEGVTVSNAPGWTMRPVECESVFIESIRIRNPLYGPNADGMDITCCRNVYISDCDIETGDDGICLKSESPYGGRPGPTRNITVTNCTITTNTNGFKVGSATLGIMENITLSNLVMYSPSGRPPAYSMISGIALEMVDGGSLEGVILSNIRMENVRTPIFIGLGERRGQIRKHSLRGVSISNVYATGAILTSSILGLPGHPIEDITLSDINIETLEGGPSLWAANKVPERPHIYPEAHNFGRFPSYGFFCRHVNGLRFDNIRVRTGKPDGRPLLGCDHIDDLDISGLTGDAPDSDESLLHLENVRGGFIHGCRAPSKLASFLTIAGKGSSRITVVGNDLLGTQVPVRRVSGASAEAVRLEGNVVGP